jgi:hypothetical protein
MRIATMPTTWKTPALTAIPKKKEENRPPAAAAVVGAF